MACHQGKNEGKASSAAPGEPVTDEQKAFYALGVSLGRQISRFDPTPEELSFVKAGLEAQATGKEPAVAIEVYGPKLNEIGRARGQAKAEKEKVRSKEYLEKASKEKGAQVTESGLVYIPITEGTGAQPAATDRVKVHYKGTLTDGKEFDSSYKRGEPAVFPLNGVIPCWTEGLQKMKAGGKAKLVCPSTIAYGDRGTPTIPGGAALTFEVELIEVMPQPMQPAAQPPMQGIPPGHPAIPPPPPAPTKK
jgi:FKBP-type peptidyl-prolyl cis-trans isomerase FkpA